jgi:hypothetical protein
LAVVLADEGRPAEEVTKAAKDPRVLVDLTVRTPHLDYLAYIADRDSLMLSHAFEAVLAEAAQYVTLPEKPRRVRKERLHVSIGRSWADYITALTRLWGVPRSEVARRLIDMARTREGAA